jgi:hypothetical protein
VSPASLCLHRAFIECSPLPTSLPVSRHPPVRACSPIQDAAVINKLLPAVLSLSPLFDQAVNECVLPLRGGDCSIR